MLECSPEHPTYSCKNFTKILLVQNYVNWSRIQLTCSQLSLLCQNGTKLDGCDKKIWMRKFYRIHLRHTKPTQ